MRLERDAEWEHKRRRADNTVSGLIENVAESHALIVISADLIMTVDSRLQGVSGYVYKNLSIVILSAVIKISLS